MVRPILHSISTTDDVLGTPGGEFSPRDPTHFALLIDAFIGTSDGEGADLFQFVACTPSWMANEVVRGGAHWLRHYLLLEQWSYVGVVNAVTKLCTSIDEPDWEQVACKLGRYMGWEFEDYRD